MKKLSRLLLVLTLVLLIGCTSVLLVACDDGTDQGPAPTTPSFRVSFMKNYPESGEEDVAFTNVTVRQGRTVSAYEITEDDRPAGYDFVGWFVEKDGDENFDFATKITQNVKIYAHWTENGKSTEADLKGGVFTQEKVKIKTKEGEKEVDNGVWRYVTGANNEIAHEESRFDFDTDVLRKLKAASPKTTYSVWKDEECSLTINNDATNLVVNLKNGDNVYYIKAVAEDIKVTAVYKINVYLEPKYDVSVIRIQGNYESGVTIYDVAKGQKATAPSIATYVGHTFDGWYYYSEEKRNDKGQIVDADEDSGNILVKVGDKYYLADENGNRRFAYVDANGRKVVLYKGKYYLTDKSGARLADEATEIYNRLDENGLPVYDEGKPIKVGSKTEYKWDFNVNVIDREDITVFGKWTTNTYSITLKISEADKANGAKFAKTNETELFIGGVNFGATDKAIEQLISNKIGETTDSSRPVEKPFATFAGWYYTDDLGNEIKVVDENGNGVHAFDFAKDIDLVAKFNAVTYKLVVNANDDSMMQEVTGSNDAWPYDQKATFTANPKDGYTLVRWLLNGEEYAPFGANKSVEYNIDEKHAINKTITFTAVFAPKDINVTLVDTVDNYGKTFVVKYNSDVVLGQDAIPDVPKLSNDGTKRFIGWYYLDSEGTKTYVVKYNVNKNEILVGKWAFTEDVTLTAKWVPIEYFVIENGVIVGIDENKAKKGDSYKTEFTINFDDAVHAIKDGAFKNNKFIRKITIKGNIQTIGEEAFANSNIEEVVFEGNFKGLAIGVGAFRNCVRIKAITLPDNVEQIGNNVFEGCYNLTNLAYSAEIPLGRLFTTVNPQNDNWYEAKQGDVTYYLPKKLKEIVVTNTATAIADYAFQNASQLTKVTLATQNGDKPYTTKIGNYAFANTGSIEVNLGSVEIIGNAAFRNSGIAKFDNNGVATVELIALKKLGVDAFNGTTRITFVDFSKAPIDNVSARAFANSSIARVNLGRIKTISMSAFADSQLSIVSDGESVETIKKMAFYKTKITTLDGIFQNVVDIEENAFHETDFFNTASGLVVIGKVLYSAKSEGGTITPNPNVVSIAPEAFKESQYAMLDLSGFSNLKYIESYAFAYNSSIVEVTLPASLSEIKDNAFKGCSSIKKINLSACSNISRIWQYAFANCKNLDTITFATFTSTNDMAVKLAINDYAFSGCIALKTLNLPENLGTLDSYAFKGCTALTTVNFVANAKFITPETTEGGTDPAPEAYDPAGLVTTIGDGAFMDCTSLTTITLPYFIARIGNSAFENCTALATFTTMDGADKKTAALRTIGDRAFFGNTSLNNVDVNTTKGVNTIGVSAFENCGQLATINLSGVTRFAEGVFRNAKALKSVTMSASASIYVGQEAFRNCVTLSDITGRIAAADDGAFRNCISLRAITFVSSGIEYIGSNAFNGCVLIQKVSIPSSVVAIGDSAFDGCRGITSLTFESNETLQTIGYSAFGGCSLLTRVILPSSLVELNASAFYGCSDLEYVEFGENIQTVGEDAFALCATGLEVRFTGKIVPVFTGDIFTATEGAKISVRQGYRATFEAVLGTKYEIVEYTA